MQPSFYQHPSAVIDEGAIIGDGTSVWHFCHVSAGAVIGRGCNLGQNVFIDSGVVVGNGVKIQNNVSVYKGVVVEDDVFLGPSMVFTNVINPRAFIERKAEFRPTIIRKGATIGANATIVCGAEVGAFALVGAGSVVSKNVPAYGLVYGVPAVQRGWVSQAGHRLTFNAAAKATCPQSGRCYLLINNRVELQPLSAE